MINKISLSSQKITAMIGLMLFLCVSASAYATNVPNIPGSADVGRIKTQQKIPTIDSLKTNDTSGTPALPTLKIPEAAKDTEFELTSVNVQGVTVFSPDEYSDIYAQYIGKNITLDMAYIMAGAITERYRRAGYFLSLAYIPPQKITDGAVIIKVVEGYIGHVNLDKALENESTIMAYVEQLKLSKPIKSEEIESFLLRLNDLAGYAFSGVLAPMENGDEGAVELVLTARTKNDTGSINIDNSGSRFLGPNLASLSFSKSLLPLHKTSVSGQTSFIDNKLKNATITHAVTLAPRVDAEVSLGYTKAKPGLSLKAFEIDSSSSFFNGSLRYQWIRQRSENLFLKFSFDIKDSVTDTLGTALTRDHVRVVRALLSYDTMDSLQGYNMVNATLSQGIEGLGSSQAGDLNLSRAQARPDFTKGELSLTRLQRITENWSLLVTAAFQRASGPLFSSEEFGYGGQTYGRAFDSSEISGDHGAAGLFELRYSGLPSLKSFNLSPYAYYDIGKVWNDDAAQVKHESGASAGLGLRISSESGFSGDVGLAFPLTRSIANPIYGQKAAQPRFLLQISKDF